MCVSKVPEEQTYQEIRTFKVKGPVWIRVYSGNSKWSSRVFVDTQITEVPLSQMTLMTFHHLQIWLPRLVLDIPTE